MPEMALSVGNSMSGFHQNSGEQGQQSLALLDKDTSTHTPKKSSKPITFHLCCAIVAGGGC